MLIAYLDDSGTSPTDSVAVVAGYLASEPMWAKFDSRWRALLAKYGIKALHRAELESFHGEFKGWNGAHRTEFLKRAHAIIRQCTYTPVGLALIKSDYDEIITKHYALKQFGIFAWCAQGCVAGVRTWCDARKFDAPIKYVFEAGTKGSSQFSHLLEHYCRNEKIRKHNRIGEWSFDFKGASPLQAADLVAYEFFKFIQNEVVEKGKRRVRLSLLDLFRPPHDPGLLKHFGKDAFNNMVVRWKDTESKRN